jgi:hypothetical protein
MPMKLFEMALFGIPTKQKCPTQAPAHLFQYQARSERSLTVVADLPLRERR